MIRTRALALIALAALLASALPARAAGGAAVLADCNSHNTLTRTYGVPALENALRTMPADVQEYTDCRDVIQRALLAEEGRLRQGSAPATASSGGSFLPTPVIVALALLALAAASLGALAWRRRRGI
jgi:hypothetical protein